MLNPMQLGKLLEAKKIFSDNHPKFMAFLRYVSAEKLVREGSVVELKITDPEGKTVSANLKVRESDLELLHGLGDVVR